MQLPALPAWLFAVLLVGCAADAPQEAVAARSTVAQRVGAAPAQIARSQTFDITSKINNRTYRIMVATPATQSPGTLYPVLYVLDGNQYFGTATDALNRQSHFKNVKPAIVVGVGYPTDDFALITRERAFDLTPSLSKDPKLTGRYGGGSAFARVLEEEIKPFVNAQFAVDTSQQIIWGQSFAGLFVLGTMFATPTAYSTYILSSPSIWWNDKEVLQAAPEFERRARIGDLRMRVLITSAGDEQHSGPDSQRAAREAARMIDNATELADRLMALSPKTVVVQRVIFDGEIHNTVSPASLSRTLRFALPVD